MYYVYVLKSINFDRRYVGFTTNIEKRLAQHNSGKTHSTKAYKPWKLIYSEEIEAKEQALKREKFFKSGRGRAFLKEKLGL